MECVIDAVGSCAETTIPLMPEPGGLSSGNSTKYPILYLEPGTSGFSEAELRQCQTMKLFHSLRGICPDRRDRS